MAAPAAGDSNHKSHKDRTTTRGLGSASGSPRMHSALPTIYEDAPANGTCAGQQCPVSFTTLFTTTSVNTHQLVQMFEASLQCEAVEQRLQDDLLLAAVEARLQELLLIKRRRQQERAAAAAAALRAEQATTQQAQFSTGLAMQDMNTALSAAMVAGCMLPLGPFVPTSAPASPVGCHLPSQLAPKQLPAHSIKGYMPFQPQYAATPACRFDCHFSQQAACACEQLQQLELQAEPLQLLRPLAC